MTYRSTALLLCPAAVAGLAALLYALTRHRKSSAVLGKICDSMCGRRRRLQPAGADDTRTGMASPGVWSGEHDGVATVCRL